jgi:antitoxin (DNA-binding transcriptional repressor) of toxin-antitoxin stability system
MIEVSVTDAVNGFHRFLGKVERGETVRIRKHGRAFARIVPDSDFMSGLQGR